MKRVKVVLFFLYVRFGVYYTTVPHPKDIPGCLVLPLNRTAAAAGQMAFF